MSYSNAQILAAVVAEWSRAAVSSLTASRLCKIPFVSKFESSITQSGLVGNYSVANDIRPYIGTIYDAISIPMLQRYFSGIPDENIPALAHNIVNTAIKNGKLEMFNNIITFELEDLEELKVLLDDNLPLDSGSMQGYKVKHRASAEMDD